MRRQALWQGVPPSEQAFESQLPFFADRMVFTEWLQWVFVARMRAILEGHHPLPEHCQIAPMAEEALRGMNTETKGIILILTAFDAHFD